MDDELKDLHQPVRLRLMAVLVRQHELGFAALRDGLGLTDGNMGSHMARLVERGWVTSRRALVESHFEVRYTITRAGFAVFRRYRAWLATVLDDEETRHKT